jgi:alpha-2-macroglobulin-like protein
LLAVTVIALDTLPDLAPSGTRGSVAKVDPPMPKLPDSVRFPPLIQGREGADAGVRVALTTDKSLYQPGDALFFRSLTLDGKTMKPLVPGTELKLRYELRSEDGTKTIIKSSEVVGVETPLLDADVKEFESGLSFGSITLPSMLPHGVYVLSAYEITNNALPLTTLKVTVGQPKTQSLAMVLAFERASYRAGDTVSAKVTVTKAGKPYGNKPFQVEAIHAENQELATVTPMIGSLDANGTVTISLELPKNVQLRSPTIKVTILDQNNESITQAIPLSTK